MSRRLIRPFWFFTDLRTTLAALTALSFSVCATASDTLVVGGHIYTANSERPWVEALAITDGKIDAVGSTMEISKLREPQTRVIDLRGRTAIPGIIDSHAHTLFGSIALHGLNTWTEELSIGSNQPEKLIEALKKYAAAHPKEKILFARATFGTSEGTMPNHEVLDRAVSDRPLIVHDVGEHALWLNAKALEMAGVTEKPAADRTEEIGVVRDERGKPTGVLLEASMELAERAALKALSQEEKLALVRKGTQYLNSFGITTVINATGNLAEIELYATLRDRDQLTVRTKTAFGAVGVPHRLTPQFLNDLEIARKRYNDDWVSANLVKFFADGGSGDIPPPVYVSADYKKLVAELDKRGYQIMTHALSAEWAHVILDTYEQVAKENGARDRRWRLEHGDMLIPEDVGRFGKLAVIASMQPTFCCSADIPAGVAKDRWRSLLDSGARLAFGSDWPCTWPPNPFVGMQQAVTRVGWTGESYGAAQGARVKTSKVMAESERITFTEALDAYTRHAAYAAFLERKVGSLEPGKLADLAILSQDPTSVSAQDIEKTRVTMTMVGGRVVFGETP